MKLNNKGFTLVEVLAVVIIMSIIIAIMVPNVNSVINSQKENTLKEIKKSIKSATTIYLSDNKYNLSVNGDCNSQEKLNVEKTGEVEIDQNGEHSSISVAKLIELGNLKRKTNGIKNPFNSKLLDEDNTKIVLYYDCNKKNILINEEINLVWK